MPSSAHLSILGVAAAAASKSDILLAGVAGLVAGTMSMAAGEYVSVSSQSDTEMADLAREKRELSEDPEFEKEELAQIYIQRGVEHNLARQVAVELMAKDALGAHARDELGSQKSPRRDQFKRPSLRRQPSLLARLRLSLLFCYLHLIS